MTMKASDRRVILRRMQTLMNTLITINELGATTATTLIAAGSDDVGTTINLIYSGAGEYNTEDTVSAEIIDLLDGTNGSLDWAYLAE